MDMSLMLLRSVFLFGSLRIGFIIEILSSYGIFADVRIELYKTSSSF